MYLKKIILIIIICLFPSLILSTSVFGFEKGLLWQIESPNGMTSKIFGTMHLVDEKMNVIFSLISPHVISSRIVFIEYIVDNTDNSFITDNLIHTKQAIKKNSQNKS